jgi:hypothetical protein
VTLRSTVSECPFCVPPEDGIFLTQARALVDGDVAAIMRIFGPDGYSRKREVVLTYIAKWTVKPRPTSKHSDRDIDLAGQRSSHQPVARPPDTMLTPPRTQYGAICSKPEQRKPLRNAEIASLCKLLQRVNYHS